MKYIKMELAPTVIHQEMLITAIKEQSKPGEMMRLNEENPIDFNSIESIRLEFLGERKRGRNIFYLNLIGIKQF